MVELQADLPEHQSIEEGEDGEEVRRTSINMSSNVFKMIQNVFKRDQHVQY